MIEHLSPSCICLPWKNPYINLWARLGCFPFVLCSGMDYGTVRSILNGAIASPAEVHLPALDEAIRWVEDKGTIRRLDRGADRDVYSQQFDAAAVEMRVLRRLLAHSEFIGATESARRVLKLLGS